MRENNILKIFKISSFGKLKLTDIFIYLFFKKITQIKVNKMTKNRISKKLFDKKIGGIKGVGLNLSEEKLIEIYTKSS